MSVKLSPIPRKQFTDVNGNPLNGGKLFYYVSGTATKAITYSDAAGTVANTNPIILDSSGRCPVAVYLVDGVTYEEVLAPSTDTDPPVSPIYAEPDIIGTGASTAIADEWIASNYVPTFISATSFSVPGDVTAVLEVGRRLKTTDSAGVNYSRILTSSFAAGVTTVTVLVDGGLLLDSGLSTISYSILSVTNSAIPISLTPQSIKNPIVNGGFRISQAGTTFAAAVNLAYDLDGWTNENTSAAVFTIAKVQAAFGVGSGNQSIFKRTVTVTTADAAVAAGDYTAQRVAIEGYDTVALISQTFTLGFWVASSVVGIHCVSIYDGTKSYISEYTINVADTPEYKTITIIGGLQTTASYTNTAGIYVFFSNMNGTTHQTTKGSWNVGFFTGTSSQVNDMATIGNVFALSDVTIQLGYAALPDRLSYEEDLRKCKRYYQTIRLDAGFIGDTTSGTTYYCNYNLPVEMRTTPTASGVNQSSNRFPAVTGTIIPISASYIYETRVASATGAGGFFGSTITALARL